MHLLRVRYSLETVTVLAGNQRWLTPFLLPAQVPHASEVTLGQTQRKMLNDFPFSLLPSGRSLANTSRMGDKHLPQYLFVHGRNECRKEEKNRVIYTNLEITELHAIIFNSAPLGCKVWGPVVHPGWTPVNGCKTRHSSNLRVCIKAFFFSHWYVLRILGALKLWLN